ncbi:NAD-dependent protein deacylase [Kordia sp. SMS9]|uniref:SIR2 family NAD-dependent protein deacylase n=1 Tax=Kordia sp. SMS9 TaxID=2282170 RepID=UPI000E0D9A37|nr:Sir2 family NAD-dependent protein deacetylase [Kordia sp. SMS9]AXG71740.1 NAD-dependent protein deacylase [Kordia sp. SMS9]
MEKEKVVVLTGAGISAESGIKTFRDADGLWEGHDIMEVASPTGFEKNPALVLDFYNQRRRQLKEVVPNEGHKALVLLEEQYDVTIVTQNVDNLHERAGSSKIIHLHGELSKMRGVQYPYKIYDCSGDIYVGDVCKRGSQLRPHIVWFGEDVPMIETAIAECTQAAILMIIGTSMQVYPAASLINFVPQSTPIYFIDPKPSVNESAYQNLTVIAEKASTGVAKVIEELVGF